MLKENLKLILFIAVAAIIVSLRLPFLFRCDTGDCPWQDFSSEWWGNYLSAFGAVLTFLGILVAGWTLWQQAEQWRNEKREQELNELRNHKEYLYYFKNELDEFHLSVSDILSIFQKFEVEWNKQLNEGENPLLVHPSLRSLDRIYESDKTKIFMAIRSLSLGASFAENNSVSKVYTHLDFLNDSIKEIYERDNHYSRLHKESLQNIKDSVRDIVKKISDLYEWNSETGVGLTKSGLATTTINMFCSYSGDFIELNNLTESYSKAKEFIKFLNSEVRQNDQEFEIYSFMKTKVETIQFEIGTILKNKGTLDKKTGYINQFRDQKKNLITHRDELKERISSFEKLLNSQNE